MVSEPWFKIWNQGPTYPPINSNKPHNIYIKKISTTWNQRDWRKVKRLEQKYLLFAAIAMASLLLFSLFSFPCPQKPSCTYYPTYLVAPLMRLQQRRGLTSRRRLVVRMAPDEEKMTKRSPLDFTLVSELSSQTAFSPFYFSLLWKQVIFSIGVSFYWAENRFSD